LQKFSIFSSLETIHIERFLKKKKGRKRTTQTFNHEDASWEEKGRAFFGRRRRLSDDDRDGEREEEWGEERSAFGSFFATREVKKGARLNV